MRSRLKEAVCRIEGRGVHGSGFLIEYKGLVGILTVNSLVPDKDTARTCAAIFHTAAGERVQVALLPETLFLSSPQRSKVRILPHRKLPPTASRTRTRTRTAPRSPPHRPFLTAAARVSPSTTRLWRASSAARASTP